MTKALQLTKSQALASTDELTRTIIDLTTNPAFNMETFHSLAVMRDEMIAAERRRAFTDALAHVQRKMEPIRADAENPQTRSRYASYAQLDRALRPIYSKAGFSLTFDTAKGAPPDYVRVVCDVSAHGHTVRKSIDMPADGKGARGNDVMTKTHAVGSAVTYGMRYLLKMIFNVAVGEADDDGNAAGKKGGDSQISDAQCEMIRKMLVETNSNVELFCQRIGVECIPDIPGSKYPLAMQLLAEKAVRNQKQKEPVP